MKIAVVTGASSGLGRDFVRALDLYGYDEIWAVARREQELLTLAEECGTKVRALSLDLKDTASFEKLGGLLAESAPKIDCLVCAAGFGRFGSFGEVGAEDSAGMIQLNCTALMQTTYLCLPYMKKGARVIEVASVAAFQPLPYMNVYAATKAFVRSFSRALSAELSGRGITVCALCPGWIRTQFIGNAEKTDSSAVTSFPGMSESPDIVKKALRAAERGKSICVPGVLFKAQHVLSHILPSRILMAAWNRIRR